MYINIHWLSRSAATMNTLNDKILNLSKLKAFADDRYNVTLNTIFVFERTENIVRKE